MAASSEEQARSLDLSIPHLEYLNFEHGRESLNSLKILIEDLKKEKEKNEALGKRTVRIDLKHKDSLDIFGLQLLYSFRASLEAFELAEALELCFSGFTETPGFLEFCRLLGIDPDNFKTCSSA